LRGAQQPQPNVFNDEQFEKLTFDQKGAITTYINQIIESNVKSAVGQQVASLNNELQDFKLTSARAQQELNLQLQNSAPAALPVPKSTSHSTRPSMAACSVQEDDEGRMSQASTPKAPPRTAR
jgi:hypothetical protein